MIYVHTTVIRASSIEYKLTSLSASSPKICNGFWLTRTAKQCCLYGRVGRNGKRVSGVSNVSDVSMTFGPLCVIGVKETVSRMPYLS
jgi:hypothetical protein